MGKAYPPENKKRKLKNNKLRFVVIFAILIYVLWVVITQQVEIEGKKKTINQIKSQIAAQQQIKQQLDKKMEKASSKEYLEQAARERLGFARPDEIIFYDAALKK
ncbi:MAG: septum formation initiator family protein [Firmicutes bacterium]|nr:septum formation initiator family protein [Bacillota bacterium]